MSTCSCRHNISPTTRTIGYWDWTYLSLFHTFLWWFGKSSYLIVLMTVIVVPLMVICFSIAMLIFYLFHFHSQSKIMTCCMLIVAVTFIFYTSPNDKTSSPWTESRQISNPAHNACCILTACQWIIICSHILNNETILWSKTFSYSHISACSISSTKSTAHGLVWTRMNTDCYCLGYYCSLTS